jgi:hypothetical protein
MDITLDLVKDYLSKISRGEAKLSPAILREFKKSCGDSLEKQFTKQEWRLRMSGVGKPLCQQQLGKQGIEEELDYTTIMRFIFGNLIEAVAIAILKGAGVEVSDEQKRVSVEVAGKTISGSMDLKIKDLTNTKKIWDVKSASPYSFDRKFGEFGGYSALKQDDPFGYIAQGLMYEHADGDKFGGWIAINKSTGEWAVCAVPDDIEEDKKEVIDSVSMKISMLEDKNTKFRKFPDKIELHKEKGKKGNEIETGNRLMHPTCSMCGYKKHCWPKAILHKKVAGSNYRRPFVWYTKLVNRELEPCP